MRIESSLGQLVFSDFHENGRIASCRFPWRGISRVSPGGSHHAWWVHIGERGWTSERERNPGFAYGELTVRIVSEVELSVASRL